MKTKMKRKYTAVEKRENRQLYLLMLPVFILIAVFCYAPMFGIVIAFQDYWPGDPFFGDGAMWVGLDNFKRFVQGEYFGRLIKNTLVLSGLNLIYVNGLITKLLTIVGLPNINWRQEPSAFPTIYTFTNVWKLFGFNSILYMSTISSIDQGLYEAAKIDGANRWQQCWHVTLAGLKPIIAINLIMQVGSILSTNSDLILLLYTPATYDVADVIGTYTYRMGILNGEYSFTTAAGLFMSVIGFALTYICNKISNKLTGFGLW